MSDITNTLSGLLAGILRREKNSLQIIQTLSDLYSNTTDKVTLEYVDENNEIQTTTIPSYGYLLQQLKETQGNLNNLAGIGVQKASIKLADGSKRVIFGNELPIEPTPITSISKPILFYSKSNNVIDKLVDPLPYIKVDITGKITSDVSQLYVKKLVLNIENDTQLSYFNSELAANNVAYNDLIAGLGKNGINYQEFDEIKNLPPKLPKYSGSFDLLRVYKKPTTIVANNQSIKQDVLVYKLNTLLYNDLEFNKANISLKIGDQLIVNSNGIRNTKMLIQTVDQSTNEVTLKRTEGFDLPKIGTNKLLIDPSYIKTTLVDVEINGGQYIVVFLKTINPNSNIVNQDWGSGIAIATDNLVFADEQTTGTTLAVYKNDKINNLSKSIKSLSNDRIIPLVSAATPNVPVLAATNCKVVVINNHKKDAANTDNIKKKVADKEKAKSEISNIDKSIEDAKAKLNTVTLDNDKQKILTDIKNLNNNRDAKVKEYNTIVNDIIARQKDSQNFVPKYKIVGFWNVPDPVIDSNGDAQYPKQFKYRYRYLSKDNSTTELTSLSFTDQNDKTNKATPTKWVEVVTKPREKGVDDNGKMYWKDENVSDPDILNSNQLSISISAGENVEIQVKTISEAGDKESDWSPSVIIPFPEDLNDNTDSIAQDIQKDAIKAEFLNDLTTMGVPKHIQDSIQYGDTYFTHDADSIATAYRTPENKPKSVAQILSDYKSQIDGLTAIINGDKGQIQVQIVDENGALVSKVGNNDSINIFAGYYKDIVSNLTIKKGVIVTKLYYLEISNINAIDLELLSYVPGLVTDPMPIQDTFSPYWTGTPYGGYLINKDEYNLYRRYWRVPVSLRGMTPDNPSLQSNHLTGVYPFIELPTFQSSQVKGQFLLMRNYNVALSDKLYDGIQQSPTLQTMVPINPGLGTQQTFIWNETLTTGTPNGNGYESDFCVHTDHPELALGSELMNNFSTLFHPVTKTPIKSQETSGQVYYPFFCQSLYSNLKTTDPNGNLQLEYTPYVKVTSGATVANFAKKIGYTKNDQYLIGKNTCGSYLYLAPNIHKDIHTGELIYNKGKIIKQGDVNKIRIPIIFQVRATDYYGAGSSGLGILGGLGSPTNLTNIAYAKTIGIDIPLKNQDMFSFDVRLEMQYKSKSVSEI